MMTREEAKEVFLNRGFIKVDGGTIYDANKWREACAVISKWLEQEPCEELYRLITDSNSLMLLENYKTGERTVIEKRLEPCEDCISRKDAVFALNEAQIEYDENYKGLGKAKEIIGELPPVQPEEKVGEWVYKGWHGDWQFEIDGRGNCWKEFECSNCNKISKAQTDFCPNCGAKMKGEKEC